MTGYARVLLSDWIKLAENRVRADQTAQVRTCVHLFSYLIFCSLMLVSALMFYVLSDRYLLFYSPSIVF